MKALFVIGLAILLCCNLYAQGNKGKVDTTNQKNLFRQAALTSNPPPPDTVEKIQVITDYDDTHLNILPNGLNDYIKKESERLYNDLGNVNVIALDLYDGKVATTREDAGKFMQAVKEDRAQAIIKGAIEYAGPKARIATIGWCFGGGWSLQASIMAGKQDVACVMYYGMPEKSVDRLKTLNADVLGNFANKDQWINPKVVAQFETDMKEAGKKLYVHEFDADHAFANPSNPHYNKDATADAYSKAIPFIKERMK